MYSFVEGYAFARDWPQEDFWGDVADCTRKILGSVPYDFTESIKLWAPTELSEIHFLYSIVDELYGEQYMTLREWTPSSEWKGSYASIYSSMNIKTPTFPVPKRVIIRFSKGAFSMIFKDDRGLIYFEKVRESILGLKLALDFFKFPETLFEIDLTSAQLTGQR
jgi:hypothetical protein